MIIDIIKSYSGISVIDCSGEFSFNDLLSKISKFESHEFLNNVKKHDRVIIYSDYSFDSIALLICLSKHPVNIIPIVKTTEKEFIEKVKEVSPNFILSFDKFGDLIVDKFGESKNLLDYFNQVTIKNDTGIILFSSGTTGKPKVMIQNLSNLIREIKIPRKQKTLTFILLLMFDHIGGLNTLLNCLISGTPFVIPRDRSPETILELIHKHKVNVLPTTPTFLNLMLMSDGLEKSKISSLKLITYGTERMSQVLLTKLNLLLPKIKFLQTFGTSETGILKTISKSSSSLFFKITDDEKEFKVVNGELFLKSKTSVEGYLNHDNENFKSNGWYATGDLVELDEDNYMKIIGRKNKIINVGGLKVLPKEIEDVVNAIDEVDDSYVFGEKIILLKHCLYKNFH